MTKSVKWIFAICLILMTFQVSCKKNPSLEALLEQAKTLQEQSKFAEAIVAYQDIVKFYPKASQAPQCQFMIGYLYSNHLNNKDLAKKSYEEFIKKFPEHELVKDAQWELDHLGMDVNKIDELNKILSTNSDTTGKLKPGSSKDTLRGKSTK